MRGYMDVIMPNGVSVTSSMDKPPSLDFVGKLVGGYVEVVPHFSTTDAGHECIAFCNEFGRIESMHRNERATSMWCDAWQRALGAVPFSEYLVGTVVVLTGDAEFMAALKNDD